MRTDYLVGEPLTLAPGSHLLGAPDMAADHWNVVWEPGRPRLGDPVFALEPDPWANIQGSCKVLYDDRLGRYRMWYIVAHSRSLAHCFRHAPDPGPLPGAYCLAYAESTDAIHWQKPTLDVCRTRDGAPTNIVHWGEHGGQLGEVIEDAPGARRRFAMVYLDMVPGRSEGICLKWSDDGIHWGPDPDNPVLRCHNDCKNNVVFSPELGRYVLITRPHPHSSGIYEWEPPGTRHVRRRIAVSTSEDLRHWSPIRTILYPEAGDEPDFDNMTAMRCGNDYVGFLHTFDDDAHSWQCHTAYVALSGDALHWHVTRPTPFLAPGFSGQGFDDDAVGVCGTHVPCGDRILLFYVARSGSREKNAMRRGRLAMLSLRKDGFVACRPGAERGAYLLTREFVVPGAGLTVNCNATGGSLRVEVLHGPGGEVCDGYGREACKPVRTDSVAAPVRWQTHHDLAQWVGKPVRLRFVLANTSLYAFSCSL